jgi:hypothetical protein
VILSLWGTIFTEGTVFVTEKNCVNDEVPGGESKAAEHRAYNTK